MDAKLAVPVSFGLLVRIELIREKWPLVVLGSISGDRSGIQPDKRSIHNSLAGKKEHL